MRVGIIQSNFLPWRGYFDFIDRCDLFIVHDDIQYTKGDWRNRNRIKTPSGSRWISVPVHYGAVSQSIEDTPIDYSTPWARRMLNTIRNSYQRAPHFDPYFAELSSHLNAPAESISDLNLRLIHWVCRHLRISTPVEMSRTYQPEGRRTDRLIGILKRAGASEYLSGPAARAYLQPDEFEKAGIKLTFMTYDYPPYEQLHPPYDPAVSIIDPLFTLGSSASSSLTLTTHSGAFKES